MIKKIQGICVRGGGLNAGPEGRENAAGFLANGKFAWTKVARLRESMPRFAGPTPPPASVA